MNRIFTAFAVALLLVCTLSAQVSVAPYQEAKPQFFTNGGLPCSGCTLTTYTGGTTSPLATYTDSTGTVTNPTIITLNSAGYPPSGIWPGPFTYKYVLKDAFGSIIKTVDNVTGLTGLNYLKSNVAATITQPWIFSSGISGTGSTGALTLGSGALGANIFTGAQTDSALHTMNAGASVSPSLTLPRVLPATTSPTLSGGSAGNPNGTYQYSVTYVTANGETERASLSSPITVVNQQIQLTAIPVSPSSAVTARKIYRNKAAASDPVLQQLVTTISDNTSTAYVDNIADSSLGAFVPEVSTADGVVKYGADTVIQFGGYGTALGLGAMPNNTGYANVSIGQNSMTANTTGFRDTAIGMFALYANTTGSRNTAGGVHSLGTNTTNVDNTAFGYAALGNADASFNTAFGSNALNATTSGGSNTAIGEEAMNVNTTGANNTALGYNVMWHNTTGLQNTAVGDDALVTNTTGNFNTAVGRLALQANSTGSGNVALGFEAGYYETGSNHLWVDTATHTNLADAQANALMYGTFTGSAATQTLRLNASLQLGANSTTVFQIELKNNVAGCATAASAGAICTTTVTWSNTFADTNYVVNCIGVGITSGVPVNGGITNRTASAATFQTVAATAAAAQYGTIECSGLHP